MNVATVGRYIETKGYLSPWHYKQSSDSQHFDTSNFQYKATMKEFEKAPVVLVNNFRCYFINHVLNSVILHDAEIE